MLDVFKTLTIDNQPIDAKNLISLLTNYEIISHFLREMIIEKAIANISCTTEEQAGTKNIINSKLLLGGQFALMTCDAR